MPFTRFSLVLVAKSAIREVHHVRPFTRPFPILLPITDCGLNVISHLATQDVRKKHTLDATMICDSSCAISS